MEKMRPQKLLVFLVLLTLCLSVIQLASVTPAIAQSFPVTITDDAGRTITIQSEPQRIVSLAPSLTETLFALGLGDKVVGVTEYCDYPPEVKTLVEQGKITIIGGYTTPNVEIIIGLNPDLVLGHKLMGEDNLKALEDAGITVLVFEPEDIDGIYSQIERIGKATGEEEAAANLIDAMKARIDAVKQKVSVVSEKVRVAQMCWLEPIWVSGGKTFINAAIEAAGGINVFSDTITGWATVSPETVIEADPDVIIYTSMGLTVSPDEVKEKIRELFGPTKAVQNDRVYLLIGDAASMLERSGPGIVDGIETLAKIFYPSLYGGRAPTVITERVVSLIRPGAGYTQEQVKAIQEAKRILTQEGDVEEAYTKLVEAGVISIQIKSIAESNPVYQKLIELYGENLERYPTLEGRIQLLYAMGLFEIKV
ncbi:MAG: cobalamin-binding protein [Candidatus Hecatellales archaeon]|nr:MAG: cobalamin-binding protein [Candidatus Hecatellales archaeon]